MDNRKGEKNTKSTIRTIGKTIGKVVIVILLTMLLNIPIGIGLEVGSAILGYEIPVNYLVPVSVITSLAIAIFVVFRKEIMGSSD